ncbi:SIX5 isoform 4 [Pan troglodytes]|uniref:SIX5 isoform 4 n=3 Tax=Hominidae TaxID=9604 RepID=A0A2J8U6P0_PONAB|nr:SIX5 isoform 4 [Pan troglodytes]PNJ40935.1 SIX5 isoform 4 [Pongo abelii]
MATLPAEPSAGPAAGGEAVAAAATEEEEEEARQLLQTLQAAEGQQLVQEPATARPDRGRRRRALQERV